MGQQVVYWVEHMLPHTRTYIQAHLEAPASWSWFGEFLLLSPFLFYPLYREEKRMSCAGTNPQWWPLWWKKEKEDRKATMLANMMFYFIYLFVY